MILKLLIILVFQAILLLLVHLFVEAEALHFRIVYVHGLADIVAHSHYIILLLVIE